MTIHWSICKQEICLRLFLLDGIRFRISDWPLRHLLSRSEERETNCHSLIYIFSRILCWVLGFVFVKIGFTASSVIDPLFAYLKKERFRTFFIYIYMYVCWRFWGDCIPINRLLRCFIPGSCSLEARFVSRPRVRTVSDSCDVFESWIRPSIFSRFWSESVKSWVAAQSSSVPLGIPWDAVTKPAAWKVSDMYGNIFFAEICRIYFSGFPEAREERPSRASRYFHKTPSQLLRQLFALLRNILSIKKQIGHLWMRCKYMIDIFSIVWTFR